MRVRSRYLEFSCVEFYFFGRRFGLKVKLIEEEYNWIVFEFKFLVERYFWWIGGFFKFVRIVGEGEEVLEELEYFRFFMVSFYGKSDWKFWCKFGSEIKKRFKEEGLVKFFKFVKIYVMFVEFIFKGFLEVKDFVFLFREDGSFFVGEMIRVMDFFELKKFDVERFV